MNSDMIDPGIYRARATQGQIGKHEKSKNDQAVVVFEIVRGRNAGRTIRWYATINENTQKFTIPGLTACGWAGELGEDGRTMVGITSNEVDIEVVHDEYQGKTTAKVRGVLDPEIGIAGRPMTPGEQAGFKSRWGGAIEQAALAQRAAREQGGGSAGGDDFQF